MTREEVQKILAVIDVTFSNFNPDNLTATIDAWHLFLEDYSYEDINMALKIFVRTSDSGFAPNPSQLIGVLNKSKALAMETEVDVWREVRPAIRNGLYHFQEEYDKLSPMAKKMVGDAQQLREWAMLPSEDIDTVVQSNFKSRFNTMQKRDKELNAMPMEVRQMIEEKMTMMIEDKKGE